MIDQYDDQEGYCRMLGHRLPFRYCRNANNDELPCRKIVDCWYDVFPVLEFLAGNYSEEELKEAFGAQPKTRMATLIEIINRARDQQKG